MAAKKTIDMTRELFGELLEAAADDLDGQGADRRHEAEKEPDANGRLVLRNDARRLEAIARNIRANKLARVRQLVLKCDTAVQDLMPAILLNHLDRDAHVKEQPCYCSRCAYWAIDFKHF